MILSDWDIRVEVDCGRLGIEPWEPGELLQPASYDVRLGSEFRVLEPAGQAYVDAERPEVPTKLVGVTGRPFMLHPHEFALGSTVEVVRLGDRLSAQLNGKSTLGRLGLVIHSTAGWVDPGFEGDLTLELSNDSVLPIALWPGMRIGQLTFAELKSPAAEPYEGKYKGQRGPTAARRAVDDVV